MALKLATVSPQILSFSRLFKPLGPLIFINFKIKLSASTKKPAGTSTGLALQLQASLGEGMLQTRSLPVHEHGLLSTHFVGLL